MASIISIGDKFRAQVRRTGLPTITKTFPTKKLAEEWAVLQELHINTGNKVGIQGKTGLTLEQAIDRYLAECQDISRTGVYSLLRIKNPKTGLGAIFLHKLDDDHIYEFIKRQNLSPIGGHTLFSPLCTVLKKARVAWKYQVRDIVKTTSERLVEDKLIGPSGKRTRRPSEAEIAKLLAHDANSKIPIGDIIRFAIETTMRCSEIARITWNTYSKEDQTVLITERKHPKKKKINHQTVPLLSSAIEIIERQPKKEHDERIFPFDTHTIGALFTKMCKDLDIKDLHFHDLRHEGTTRLIEKGYQPHIVKMFTGHESMAMLERYTHLNAKDIKKMEGLKEAPKPEPVAAQAGTMIIDAATMEQFKMFQAMQAMMAQQKAA